MRLVEFRNIDNKRLSLIESARIQHAEDLIFWEGSNGASRAIQQLQALTGTSKALTIKWDGSPAVVFGRNPNGEFIFTDKSGFVAKGYDGRATNADDLEGAIMQRAKGDKTKMAGYKQYASKMKSIFGVMQNAVSETFQGYLVGDMLYFETPKKSGKDYVFKPNVVEYKVNGESVLGQRIGQSKVGVVVHNLMSEKGRTMPAKKLDMIQGGEVLAVPPTTVNKKEPIQSKGVDQLKGLLQDSGKNIDKILDKNTLAQMKLVDLPNILYTYTNSKVDTGMKNLGKDFIQWLQSSTVSQPKKIKITEYVKQNLNGFSSLWMLVSGIMQVKDSIIQQLDSAQGDVQATVNGRPGGEGYVLAHPTGDIKFVNRAGFSAANRAVQR